MFKFNCPRQHGLDCVRNGCTEQKKPTTTTMATIKLSKKKKKFRRETSEAKQKRRRFFSRVYLFYMYLIHARPANLRDKRTGERVKIYFHRLL